MSTSTRGDFTGGLSAECVDALSTHKGHEVVEDSPMFGAEDAEDILWCETCSVTVWYLESDCSPDA